MHRRRRKLAMKWKREYRRVEKVDKVIDKSG